MPVSEKIKLTLSQDGVNMLKEANLIEALIRIKIIEEILQSVNIDKEEGEEQLDQFRAHNNILNENDYKVWLEKNKETRENIYAKIIQPLKLKKYCNESYSKKAENRFLDRKTDLDQVIYSLIRVSDPFQARELYLQIKEGESEFGKIAKKYSQGLEARSCGIIGPTPINKAHPLLSDLIKSSKEGEVKEPIQIGEFNLLVRVETFIPAILDEKMKEKMCQEMFNEYLTQEVGNELRCITDVPITSITNN